MYKRQGHGVGYIYPHDLPEGVAAQPYLPDTLANARYYRPSGRGAESLALTLLERIRGLLGRK